MFVPESTFIEMVANTFAFGIKIIYDNTCIAFLNWANSPRDFPETSL